MPTTITSIGTSPTLRTLKRTTAKMTYSSPSIPVVSSIRRVSPASRPYALRFMGRIVVLLLLLVAGLNAPSTASAANRCLRLGSQPRPPQALVVARPGTDPVRAVERGAQDGDGHVVLRRARAPCAQQFWLQRNGAFALLWVDGWAGTISSDTTGIPGLVAATDVSDAVRGGDHLEPGGDVDLAALRNRLERNGEQRFRVRLTLVAILL